MNNVGKWIRSEHWAAYKSGEWGYVVDELFMIGRPCYYVEWPDGKTDYWPVDDEDANYEFSEVGT